MGDKEDTQKKLMEAIEEIDKTVAKIENTVNKMFSFFAILLLVLFAVVVIAIVLA